MKLNFCTLFDTFYLTRGLAMYHSLEMHSKDFHLYIFAFDDESLRILNELALKHATIISLKAFESSELLEVKPGRTQAEYCWTSTSSTILYCLQRFKLDHCIYLDADLIFYRDPIEIVKNAGNNSVIITPHNYTKKYDQSDSSGKFCVQFMYFKNDAQGLKVLNWWVNACIDWCYARHEDGKFGDQKYLDDWETRFEGIYVTSDLGIGLAPWNIQQVELFYREEELRIKTKATREQSPVYFYHFHGFKFLNNGKIDLCDYELNQQDLDILYKPYISDLLSQYKAVTAISTDKRIKSEVNPQKGFKSFKRKVSRKVKKIWNVIDLKL
jgi:hypothetical protein